MTSLKRKGYSLRDDLNLQNKNINLKVLEHRKGASQEQVEYQNRREAGNIYSCCRFCKTKIIFDIEKIRKKIFHNNLFRFSDRLQEG